VPIIATHLLRTKRLLIAAPLCAATMLLAHSLATRTVSADSTSVRRGAELFANNGCAHCHGSNGIGGGKGPDLKDVKRHKNATAMAAQIHDGGKNMPPYGDALDAQQIADLVDYLRTKRKAAPTAPPAKTPPLNQDPGN
jgi:mono/diheme cytochrome c family protein